ncbi:MAG: lipoate--protein ligase [Bacteroidales bacterium]|jgi:lipoate-protein ligase A|nr:lipoate--protein ligase [Bacteroidales bacterium]
MLIIKRRNTDPYFNLATEEFILKNFDEDSFMLWRNAPCIVVGKHQNTLAEINVDYVKHQNIPVVRRLSGGGAVFHDLGNLNFTFIQKGKQEALIDFRKYTLPILEVLQKMGITAKFEGRNDLTIKGRKFSGNAEHIWKNKVLHHGTLLFSSHMPNLNQALNADPLKFQDKAVKSVRSRVTNISEHLKSSMDVMQFAELIQDHMTEKYPDARIIELSQEDHDKIHELVRTKYGTWEWNFGYSPNYNFRKLLRTEKSGTLEFDLEVQNGIIQHLKIFGDYFNTLETEEIEAALTGVLHQEDSIRAALQPFKIDEYFADLTISEFLDGLF